MKSNSYTATMPEVRQLVKRWSEKMGLSGWEIQVSIVGESALPGKFGSNEFSYEFMRSKILIAEEQETRENLKDTVKHELLHLVWWWVMPDQSNSIMTDLMERSIRVTSEAMGN